MSACKTNRNLKINGSGLPTINIDASVDFETEVVESNVDRLWAQHTFDYNISGGNPRLTLLVSNTNVAADFVPYKNGSTNVNISNVNNRAIFDDDQPYIFFKWVYVSNGATGSFSISHFEAQDG